MSDDQLFLQAQHPKSLRYAIFEDNGTSAWLYLTEPDEPKPAADVWVYNRIEAPSRDEIRNYRDGPPPAAVEFAGPNAICSNPRDYQWTLLWSKTGDAVAVVKNGTPVACIVPGHERGFCRELVRDGPWGSVWSEDVFREAFDSEA